MIEKEKESISLINLVNKEDKNISKKKVIVSKKKLAKD